MVHIDSPVSERQLLAPRKHKIQFSVRTLLLLIAVACLFATILAKRMQTAAQQVHLATGRAELASLVNVRRFIPIRHLGVHAIGDADIAMLLELEHIEELSITNTSISDAVIPTLAELPRLRRLTFRGKHRGMSLAGLRNLVRLSPELTINGALCLGGDIEPEDLAMLPDVQFLDFRELTDEDLAHFKELHLLQNLRLRDCELTDKGLRCLSKLPWLRKMDFSNTRITGEGFATFEPSPVTSGVELRIRGCPITPQGFHAISSLGVYDLDARMCVVNDESLQHISGMSKLWTLRLCSCGITNDGLESILKLKGLEELSICDNPIDSDALTRLTQLTKLKVLRLSIANPVEELAEFRLARPDVVVTNLCCQSTGPLTKSTWVMPDADGSLAGMMAYQVTVLDSPEDR